MKLGLIYIKFFTERVFYVLVFLLIGLGAFCFTLRDVTVLGCYLSNPIYNIPSGQPAWLYYMEYFSLVFLFAALYQYLVIVYYSYARKDREQKDTALKGKCINDILLLLCADHFEANFVLQKEIEKYNKKVRSNAYRVQFIEAMSMLHHKTVGKIREQMQALLQCQHCNSLVGVYLHSPYIRHKKIAFNVISEFRLEGYESYLLKLAHQRYNMYLHNQALVCLLKTDFRKNMLHLMERDVKLSLWDLNMIVHELSHSNDDIPFEKMFGSKNHKILLLALLFVRRVHVPVYKPEIQRLCAHEDVRIQKEAIKAFCVYAVDTEDFSMLISDLKQADDDTLLHMIDAFARCTDLRLKNDFFATVIETRNPRCKIRAMEELLLTDINAVISYRKSSDELVRNVCQQVLEIRV